MPRRDFKRSVFWLIKPFRLKIWSVILKNSLGLLVWWSNIYVSLLSILRLKQNHPSCFSHNIWKPFFYHCYLPFPVCITLFHMVKLFHGWIYILHVLWELSKKVAPLVRCVSSNHSSSMNTRLSQNNLTLLLDVWSDFFLNVISSHFLPNL